ncbi:hypothetical protein [Algirhabdus cladophorae]|uniref:hypothetical protein n=1 Tax=Algirhabdus cladophorae TaxID=3377108 RepID=UPI003B845216
MKPSFALSLSADGIFLTQKLPDGWYILDSVDPTSADLKADMAQLQIKAAQASPDQLRTKLIIPNDQIKYIQIPINASSEAQRLDQIQTAVSGATPYALNEVSFDWRMKGVDAQIAIVARDTLAEAEGFASDFGFAPVCFVASPNQGEFAGEPFFGMSSGAAAYLPEGETVERDDKPVVPLGPLPAPPEPDVLQDVNVSAASVPDREDVPNISFSSTRTQQPEAPAASPASASDLPPEPQVARRITLSDSEAQPLAPAAAPPPPPAGEAPSLGTASRDFPPTAAVAPTAFAEHPAAPYSAPPVTGRSAAASPEQAAPVAQYVPNRAETATAVVTPDVVAPAAPDSDTPKKGGMSGLMAKRQSKKALKKQNAAVVADEADKFTVFGARKSRDIGGKPKFLGLILTGVLLLFLALVAIFAANWDSPAVSWLFGSEGDTTVAGTAPAQQPEDAVVINVAATDLGLTQTTPQTPSVLSQPLPNAPTVVTLDTQEIYISSGIWTASPASPQAPVQIPDELNALYVASIDPIIDISDAVALPARRTLGTDGPYTVLQAPLAASVLYALNPQGLVIATPEGALTPDGYRVYAGKPVSVPSERPEFEVEIVQPIDPRVLGVRPKLRPEGIFERRQREELGGYTRIELASLRPKLRPEGLTPLPEASQATNQATAQALAEATEQSASLADPDAIDTNTDPLVSQPAAIGGTKLAVAASRIPKKRPNNFGRTVAKRLEQNKQNDARVVATVAPRAIKPSGPINSTVARNATTANAISLNKINLIGVFGSTSSREAMVRLRNGRMVKVQAGDRLDGGRVAAIGDGQLRYVKNGRNITLKMPKG